MSSYLDVREPNHQLSSAGSVLASVSDPGVVERRCCAMGAEVYLWGGVQMFLLSPGGWYPDDH